MRTSLKALVLSKLAQRDAQTSSLYFPELPCFLHSLPTALWLATTLSSNMDKHSGVVTTPDGDTITLVVRNGLYHFPPPDLDSQLPANLPGELAKLPGEPAAVAAPPALASPPIIPGGPGPRGASLCGSIAGLACALALNF